jgi:cobalt-zinc-cadmium resistance protein CzcA
MLPSLGQPNVLITPDRLASARYGLNVGDIEATVQAAVGGEAITAVYEGEKRFDLTVRWLPSFRESISAIRAITISTPDGAAIPLGQIAKIERVDSATRIFRENGMRDVPVKFSVRGRDLASTIAEAQAKIAKEIRLPYDAHLEWSGQINELNEAEARLKLIIPLTLLLIVILVFGAVKNWLDTAIVMINIPVASTGGLLALLATGTNFSVSATMGFISVFGIAIQDAILVVTYFQRLRKDGLGIEEAAREAAEKRLRPVLMTTLVAMIGLLPAAISQGIGAQAQKPLAIVVIGGSLMLAVLPRMLQPPLLVLAHRFMARRSGNSNGSATEDGDDSIEPGELGPEVSTT